MIDEIKAALKRATPGPWKDEEVDAVSANGGFLVCDLDGCDNAEWNVELIASAPAWLEHLIARVESLEAKLERTKEHWRRQREETEMIEQAVYDELDEENAKLRAELAEAQSLLENFATQGNFIQVDMDIPANWTSGDVYICKLVDDPFVEASAFLASRKENKG